MFLALLTFITAFAIEGLATYISVIGLSSLFGANPIIIAVAIALDVGKILVVTLLYKYWREMNVLMRTYSLIAAVITMIITSAGAAGYLTGEFQKAIVGTQQSSLQISVLQEERARLEARKQQIDDQIANLPQNFSRARINLMREFEAEQSRINDRLFQISEQLPQLQIEQIGTEAKAGPILYISKALEIEVEEAVKWVVLMIIFVFDPLAVFLVISGNFLLERHQRNKQKTKQLSLTEFSSGGSFNNAEKLMPQQFIEKPVPPPGTIRFESEIPPKPVDVEVPPLRQAAQPFVVSPTINSPQQFVVKTIQQPSQFKVEAVGEPIQFEATSQPLDSTPFVQAESTEPPKPFEVEVAAEPTEFYSVEKVKPTTDPVEPEPETITLSMLRGVKPDPDTVVSAGLNEAPRQVRSGIYARRPK